MQPNVNYRNKLKTIRKKLTTMDIAVWIVGKNIEHAAEENNFFFNEDEAVEFQRKNENKSWKIYQQEQHFPLHEFR